MSKPQPTCYLCRRLGDYFILHAVIGEACEQVAHFESLPEAQEYCSVRGYSHMDRVLTEIYFSRPSDIPAPSTDTVPTHAPHDLETDAV